MIIIPSCNNKCPQKKDITCSLCPVITQAEDTFNYALMSKFPQNPISDVKISDCEDIV